MTYHSPPRPWRGFGLGLALTGALICFGFGGRAHATPAAMPGWSARGLYEAGHAYQEQGSLGRAIVSYERAELLAPRDPTLAASLATARAAAGLTPDHAPAYRQLVRRLSPREWSGLTIAACWLLCLALAAAHVWPRRLRLGRWVAAAALVLGMASATALRLVSPRLDDAIVVARGNATLRLSPFANATVETSVPEGAHVAVTARHEGFVRVRDQDGHAGWADAASVEPLLAGRS